MQQLMSEQAKLTIRETAPPELRESYYSGTVRLESHRTAMGDRLTISARIVDAADQLDAVVVAQIVTHSFKRGPFYFTLICDKRRSNNDLENLIRTQVAEVIYSLLDGGAPQANPPPVPHISSNGWILV